MVEHIITISRDGFDICIISDDGTLYAYDEAECWNGEYYKGWKCDNYGNQIEKGTYNIRPIYKDVENENFEIVDYEIWKN